MKKSIYISIGIALGTLALAACETQSAGTGSGNVRGTQKPVAFTWQSDDSNSGDITATFANGRVFKGSYFEISHDTRVDRLDPLWDGWGHSHHSGDWRYWDDDTSNREFRSPRRSLGHRQRDRRVGGLHAARAPRAGAAALRGN